MKVILEFNLPDDEHDHKYALAGLDALLTIDSIEQEIRSYLKYNAQDGYFKDFDVEVKTLERVWDLIITLKKERQLPELH
jgi:hypothetical protein